MRETSSGLSPTEALAAKLRSALASNAMGGRNSDEAKWRTAAEGVKDAQTAWARLSPIAGADARALENRFKDACRRVNDHARRHAPPSSQSRHSGASGGPGPSGSSRRPSPPRPTALTAQ